MSKTRYSVIMAGISQPNGRTPIKAELYITLKRLPRIRSTRGFQGLESTTSPSAIPFHWLYIRSSYERLPMNIHDRKGSLKFLSLALVGLHYQASCFYKVSIVRIPFLKLMIICSNNFTLCFFCRLVVMLLCRKTTGSVYVPQLMPEHSSRSRARAYASRVRLILPGLRRPNRRRP
jgi:hypothetical protein